MKTGSSPSLNHLGQEQKPLWLVEQEIWGESWCPFVEGTADRGDPEHELLISGTNLHLYGNVLEFQVGHEG